MYGRKAETAVIMLVYAIRFYICVFSVCLLVLVELGFVWGFFLHPRRADPFKTIIYTKARALKLGTSYN